MKAEEISRLTGNLSVVERNITLFSRIISETNIPGTESAQDAQLLTKLDKSCREMQSRLTVLVSELDPAASGDLFMDALRVNDELNNIFVRYERFCRSRPQPQSSSSSSPQATAEPATGMLIDLGDAPVTTGNQKDPQGVASPGSNSRASEAEYWLNSGRTEQTNQGNSEFDQFLAHNNK